MQPEVRGVAPVQREELEPPEVPRTLELPGPLRQALRRLHLPASRRLALPANCVWRLSVAARQVRGPDRAARFRLAGRSANAPSARPARRRRCAALARSAAAPRPRSPPPSNPCWCTHRCSARTRVASAAPSGRALLPGCAALRGLRPDAGASEVEVRDAG
eukprot:9278761-Lingulodinium_polyedra.AAC.1